MKRHIESKGFALAKSTEALIDELIGRLEEKARIFAPDLVSLRLLVEKNPSRAFYHVAVTLAGKDPGSEGRAARAPRVPAGGFQIGLG